MTIEEQYICMNSGDVIFAIPVHIFDKVISEGLTAAAVTEYPWVSRILCSGEQVMPVWDIRYLVSHEHTCPKGYVLCHLKKGNIALMITQVRDMMTLKAAEEDMEVLFAAGGLMMYRYMAVHEEIYLFMEE